MCEEHKILPTSSQKDTISHLLLLGIRGKTNKPKNPKQTNPKPHKISKNKLLKLEINHGGKAAVNVRAMHHWDSSNFMESQKGSWKVLLSRLSWKREPRWHYPVPCSIFSHSKIFCSPYPVRGRAEWCFLVCFIRLLCRWLLIS